jgi:predicted nucleotidyltransferase
MVLNRDFREFIALLNATEVKYLVVGGYAVAYHGYPRYTGDLDLWVWANHNNAVQTFNAIQTFGFGSVDLKPEDLQDTSIVIQLGYPPNRIDILMGVDALEFEICFKSRKEVEIDGMKVNFIDLQSLIKNKRQTGRLQDLADVEKLLEANAVKFEKDDSD